MSDKKQLKIGIIGTAYGCADTLYQTVAPWIHLKDLGYDLTLAISHGMFSDYKDFKEDNDVKTQELLKNGVWHDYLYIQNDYSKDEPRIYQTEAEIRNKCLQYLLLQDVDYVWLVDFADEFYTTKEIDDVISYLENEPFIICHSIEFKNVIFNNKYVKGFQPSRIWKVDTGNYKLNKCYYDNDMLYHGKITRDIKTDKEFASKKIPTNIVNPLHLSWNNYERSVEKIRYHEKRWNPPNGNGCSFKVNKEKECIEWNLDYYNRIGQSIPEEFELK